MFLADQMIEKIPVRWEVTVGQSILGMLPVEKEPDQRVLSVLQDTLDLLEQSVEGDQPYDLEVYILPLPQVNALPCLGCLSWYLRGYSRKRSPQRSWQVYSLMKSSKFCSDIPRGEFL